MHAKKDLVNFHNIFYWSDKKYFLFQIFFLISQKIFSGLCVLRASANGKTSRTFGLFIFTLTTMEEVPKDIALEVSRLFPTFSYSCVIQYNEGHSCVCRGTMDGMCVVIKSGDDTTEANEEAEFADYFACNRHDNVLGSYVTNSEDFTHTIYEDLGMDLREYVYRHSVKGALNPDNIQFIFRSVILGLRHITRCGVIHSDVKPDNIFIDDDLNVKIGDFGNSFFADECGFVDTEGVVSTVNYRAPDIILGRRTFTSKVDVWSAGCVLAFLAGGKDLFTAQNDTAMVKEITSKLGGFSNEERQTIGKSSLWPFTNKSEKKKLWFDALGEDGNDLLNKMLRYCEDDRISFEEIAKHRYLQ
ncbi:putative serine/threonine protein kinase [Insectomime virus]|uniref:Serine/threonine protein kinase n=1 Tax=Tunisvirus fontaine2 TaxID=1421067 RepID=V9SGE0_9VIRU|nr:serine/threonine protein kinase [Tunisvirus fontaine2]AHA46104.1 putative serine/threonine protein kinase [Insectomime virus]AHC54827.1 serine/threonine protein kinase [Tunisvirus fontaine2]